METVAYYNFYYELLKLIKNLGKLMSLALNDLSERAMNIKENNDALSKRLNMFGEND